jgi:hypothetical protein
MDPATHIMADPKASQPLIWITFVDDKVEAGAVGSTRFESGIFAGVDWGILKLGADKSWFKEYFLYGSIFKGKNTNYKRLVFRLLPKREGWERAGKEEFHWEAFITEEGSPPYLLTQRAREKSDYVPPENVSGLPAEFEYIVPEELNWWKNKQSKDARLTKIGKFYNLLVTKKILTGKPIAMENAKKMELTNENSEFIVNLRKAKFVLHRIWWKGQIVVRGMPVTNYRIRFSEADGKFTQYVFSENPAEERESGFAGLQKPLNYGPEGSKQPEAWFNFSGELSPKTDENPNKKLKANAEIVDSGTINFIEENPNFRSAQIEGKAIKGYFVFKRESPDADFWLFQRSALPGEKRK